MFKKVKVVLGSIRFWQVTLAAAAVYTGLVIDNGFNWQVLFNSIATWLGVVAGIGSVDSFATKLNVTKK